MASQLDRNHRNRRSRGSILDFNNSSLKYCRRIGLFVVTIISVVTLNSCVTNSQQITLTSGSRGSGYQKISEQISRSAARVNQMQVLDRYNSQGSLQNLQRLLDKEVDFAIVQLDVASEAMKQGKIKTLLILTEEYVHIVARKDSQINTFADLKGKRIALGTEGSGIYFTSKGLFEAIDLEIQDVAANFSEGLQKMADDQVDALVYVGPLGASKKVRGELNQSQNLRFIPIAPSLVNYFEIQFPESYRAAKIPAGTYRPLPELPEQNLLTISTPGALITRPDVSKDKVALLTWSILSTFRQYYPFYPRLAREKDREIIYEGLIYSHPGALQVFENGDPREVWLRYLQQNQPLQSGLIMLLGTSSIGFFLRWSRKKRSDNLIKANRQAILDMRSTLANNPQKALSNVEVLRQKYRLMLIDGVIGIDVYERIERMTEVFAQQCRTLQQEQNCKSIDQILSSIEQLQEVIQNNPESSKEKIEQTNQGYRQMLLSGQIEINTYLQLEQLSFILMSYQLSASSNFTNNNSQT